MARALADSTVSDNWLRPTDSFLLIQRFQIGKGFKCAVVVTSLRPRNASSSRDVSSPLTRLRQTWGRQDLSCELLRTANVNQFHSTFPDRFLNFWKKRPK